MSEKKPDAAATDKKAEAPADGGKKKLPIKVIGIVAGLMIAEGAAVYVLLGTGKPQESHADAHVEHLVEDDSEKTQELELVSDRFQNMTSGQAWVWDLSVFLQVKNKNSDQVAAVLEQRQAELREGLAQIVGRARHTQLTEPERQTLIRQIAAYLDKIEGLSADGKPLIERVIIAKCRGFAADY